MLEKRQRCHPSKRSEGCPRELDCSARRGTSSVRAPTLARAGPGCQLYSLYYLTRGFSWLHPNPWSCWQQCRGVSGAPLPTCGLNKALKALLSAKHNQLAEHVYLPAGASMTKHHRLGVTDIYFLTTLEARCPRSRCQQGRFHAEASFGL